MTPRTLPELTPQQAFWRGVVTTLVVALPVGVFNQILVDSGDIEGGSVASIFFVVLILFGGAAGGWAVIRLSREAPLSYAAYAAAVAYALVQGLGVVKRLIWGPHDYSWFGYLFLASLMAMCGMLGGMFGRRIHDQIARGDDAGDGGT
jgi:hypothetical protein